MGSTPSRALRATIASCLLAAVPAGCGSSASSNRDSAVATTTTTTKLGAGSIEKQWSGAGEKVVMIGDSITVHARAALHERLDPQYRTKIAALVGEGFAGGPLTEQLGSPKPLMQNAANDYAKDDPAVLVLALGTNDAWQPELELDDALAGMRAIVAAYPHACVVGVAVNTWSRAERYDRGEARAINSELERLASEVAPPPTREQVDAKMIHPNSAGIAALARNVTDAVRRCTS